MKVHVYNEDMTNQVEKIVKTSESGEQFVGIIFYLKDPTTPTPTAHTKQQSAVTFWYPLADTETAHELMDAFIRAAQLAQHGT